MSRKSLTIALQRHDARGTGRDMTARRDCNVERIDPDWWPWRRERPTKLGPPEVVGGIVHVVTLKIACPNCGRVVLADYRPTRESADEAGGKPCTCGRLVVWPSLLGFGRGRRVPKGAAAEIKRRLDERREQGRS
jgi:hypothetical protein